MKRRNIVLAAAATLIAAAAYGQGKIFPDGEENLAYSVRHNIVPGDIATMIFHGREAEDIGSYAVSAELKTTPKASLVYTLDCRYGSVFKVDADMTPVAASCTRKEKKYWMEADYDWPAAHRLHLNVRKSTRPERDSVINGTSVTRDLLGTIWWLRRQCVRGEKPSAGSLILDHDAIPLKVTAWRKINVKIEGVTYPATEAVLAQDGKEVMRLAMADDGAATPLRFTLSLPFGKITGTLKRPF